MTIGRAADCDLVVADSKVSRRHARLIVEAGVAEIEDLGSSNGTLLNGHRVRRRVLRPGDRLGIGTVEFRYVEESAAARPTGDDVDLFGDEPPGSPAPLAAAPLRPPSEKGSPPAPNPEASAREPAANVVEFEDEVVAVPSPRGAATGEGGLSRQQRVLQFSKYKDSAPGLLGEDPRQWGTGMRWLVYLLVLGACGAVAYFIADAVS
ncbi:MAG: hypothetical protein Fur0037_18350 [Planctomycetota bacterium]